MLCNQPVKKIFQLNCLFIKNNKQKGRKEGLGEFWWAEYMWQLNKSTNLPVYQSTWVAHKQQQ